MPNIMEEHRNSPSAGSSRTPVGKGKKQKKSAAPAVPYSKEDSFTSTSRSRYLKDAATLSSSSSIPETSAAAPLGQNAVSDIPPVFQVPRIGSGGRPNWLPMPGIPLGLDLGLISANLKNSVSLRTWEDYLRAWSRWDSFCSTYNLSIASCNAYTALSFVTFLIHSNLSAASIHKILAGVSFFLKFFDLPALSSFYTVRQVLKGFRRSHLVRDGRRPISIDLLVKLIQTLPSVCYSPYEILLFNAAFSLAFFGALRLGEFSASNKSSCAILLDSDVFVSSDSITICIRRSKTDQVGKGRMIKLGRAGYIPICPVQNNLNFIAFRPFFHGSFFIHNDLSPLTRYQFSSVLSSCLKTLGLSGFYFSSHSFRIGAATAANSMGFSSEEVQRLGRWDSVRYKSYIRPELVTN
ncbi:uncharacterized protein LOC143930594 [Lithobates pipiens]